MQWQEPKQVSVVCGRGVEHGEILDLFSGCSVALHADILRRFWCWSSCTYLLLLFFSSWAKKLCQWRHNAQRLPVTLAWLHDLILPVLEGTEATCDQKHSTLEHGEISDLFSGCSVAMHADILRRFWCWSSCTYLLLLQYSFHREQRNCVNGGTTPRARGCLWPSRGCTIWCCQWLDWCSDPTTTSPGRDRSPMCSHPSLTVAAKWINCRQTTIVQVALAGPGTLVTLVVATSCTLFLERKLCSANSKRSPKAPLDFSV